MTCGCTCSCCRWTRCASSCTTRGWCASARRPTRRPRAPTSTRCACTSPIMQSTSTTKTSNSTRAAWRERTMRTPSGHSRPSSTTWRVRGKMWTRCGRRSRTWSSRRSSARSRSSRTTTASARPNTRTTTASSALSCLGLTSCSTGSCARGSSRSTTRRPSKRTPRSTCRSRRRSLRTRWHSPRSTAPR